jgi:hypothetical protein
MASVLKVDKLDPQSGTALEIGTSGDTITVPTGAGLTVVDEVKTNKISPSSGVAFTLGDSGDTFTVPSGATITNSGTATGFGGGKVLQVINATTTTETASSVTSYADTTLTADITCATTASKVLVLINQTSLLKNSSDNGGKIQLLRDATALGMFENDFGRDGGTGLNIVGGTGYCKLDSPSSTSALTYKTQFACSVSASASIGVQHNSSTSSITLMEIGA